MQKNMRKPVSQVFLTLISLVIFLASASASRDLNHTNYNEPQKHFVLVHGACFGAWNWYKLIPLLRSYGHKVTAIDLAASGISPIQASQVRTLSDYTKPLTDLIASIPTSERLVLVGHSYGGIAVSQAMELFPTKISVAVFLTAAMPGPNLPVSDITQQALSKLGSSLDNQLTPTGFIYGPQFISQIVFQLSPPQDAVLGTLLVRPLPLPSSADLVYSPDKYGSVKRVFIISEKDQVLPIQFQEYIIQKNPPNRVERIVGSDHMVMISQTTQLAVQLSGIAQEFP